MGVKNLWDILESCKKTLPLHHLQNNRVCVDLSCWMVQFHNVNKSHCPLKDKLYLKSLFHRLRALIALNCSLIFVTDCYGRKYFIRQIGKHNEDEICLLVLFEKVHILSDLQKLCVCCLDGSIPAIKLSTYRRRLNAGDDVILDARNSRGLSSLKRNMGSEFSCMIKEAKILGGALGIPCLDGIEEAEAQCALLNSESLCDGCFTSDSDAFLFGARTVYRDICLEGGYVVCYEMEDIERKLGFGRNSLISLAIILGSDYTQGIRGFGPESACQIVKSIGDSSVLQRFASEGMSVVKKQKSSKKKGQSVTCGFKENCDDNKKILNGIKCDLPLDNQFLPVINAYIKPKCHSADSDTVHRVLALSPVNCSQLHQICAQFFDWSPEKTDEYILPKIAERKLRQFANLRSTSSELGVCLPIHEMPVKCPVSSIVKQRKVQGRDYFEVSWDDMLISSTVPADLVESACPEKIVEFHERKAQKKKGCRKKKADIKEIDRKLQELVLDIEKESSGVSLRRLEQEYNGNAGTAPSASCTTTSKQLETEIIDLLSPLPPPPPPFEHQVSRQIDVIELSDSEASPQHAIKARELRLFIANIID